MDAQDKQLLEETLKVARENNRLLKRMYSSMRWSRFFRGLYWVVIIGSMFGAYYYLQPYLNSLVDAYKGLSSSIEKTQGIINSIPNSLQDITK